MILHTIYRIVITPCGEPCEWSCWTLNFTIILLFVYFFFMIDFIAFSAFYDFCLADDNGMWFLRLGTVLLFVFRLFCFSFLKSKTHHKPEEIQKEKEKIAANWNSVNLIDVYFFTTSIKLTIKYNFLSFE